MAERNANRSKLEIWLDTENSKPDIHAKVYDNVVYAMLRDYRFKRIMLANAERVFDTIPTAVKIELFKDAAKELLKSYKIKDVKQIYGLLGVKNLARLGTDAKR